MKNKLFLLWVNFLDFLRITDPWQQMAVTYFIIPVLAIIVGLITIGFLIF